MSLIEKTNFGKMLTTAGATLDMIREVPLPLSKHKLDHQAQDRMKTSQMMRRVSSSLQSLGLRNVCQVWQEAD